MSQVILAVGRKHVGEAMARRGASVSQDGDPTPWGHDWPTAIRVVPASPTASQRIDFPFGDRVLFAAQAWLASLVWPSLIPDNDPGITFVELLVHFTLCTGVPMPRKLKRGSARNGI